MVNLLTRLGFDLAAAAKLTKKYTLHVLHLYMIYCIYVRNKLYTILRAKRDPSSQQ